MLFDIRMPTVSPFKWERKIVPFTELSKFTVVGAISTLLGLSSVARFLQINPTTAEQPKRVRGRPDCANSMAKRVISVCHSEQFRWPGLAGLRIWHLVCRWIGAGIASYEN